MSNRVEKYRQKRILRQKTITAIFLFFFILTSGILAVDYGTNSLVAGREGIAIAAVSSGDSCIEITIMNRKIYLNTQYIKRDLENLKDYLRSIFE